MHLHPWFVGIWKYRTNLETFNYLHKKFYTLVICTAHLSSWNKHFFNKIEPDISYKMYERIQSIQYLSFPIKSLKTFNNRICWHVTRDDFINKLQILSWFVKPILIFKIAFNNILCSAFAKPKTLQGQKFQFQSSFLFESKYSRQSALLIYLLKQFIFLTSILQLIKLWKFGHQNNEDS